ncbi:MAG: hypothetical protein QXO47_10665 [Thermoproteota archaeon]
MANTKRDSESGSVEGGSGLNGMEESKSSTRTVIYDMGKFTKLVDFCTDVFENARKFNLSDLDIVFAAQLILAVYVSDWSDEKFERELRNMCKNIRMVRENLFKGQSSSSSGSSGV